MPSSLSGRRIGAFDIGPLIGAGGMGEVYRGRDSKLNRDVAIKVLLPAVASDGERLARFNREAQVLASLNHPNIAHIHGVEDGESGPLLILEYVDGPTLADRVAAGPLPVDEAIAIARQIADALEAAHERGIIHRDLKPANIKVDDNGTVKVLDFGLAKALDPAASQSGQLENSPTITSPAMTQAGLILGTAAYMSPEQAKGRVVDKRSDVWAFGCVLYEMLTGTRAFGGEDVTDTIAAVVRGEADWSKLPVSAPPQVRLLLKRCLEKDRKARISDIGVARFLLNETIEASHANAAAPASRRGPLVAIAALLIGTMIGAAAWRQWSRTTPEPARQLQFELTNMGRVLPGGGSPPMLMARDGSFVVYRGVGGSRETADRGSASLLVRKLNEAEPRLLTTGPARAPFLSPDGQWVGFFGGTQLRKVRISGGPSEVIARFEGAPRGASWGDDGQILFAASRMAGLQRVSASGGEPQAVTMPEPGHYDSWPHILPGSKAVVFTTSNEKGGTERIDAVDLTTSKRKTLLTNGYAAQYMASGHIVFAVSASAQVRGQARAALRAARFDVRRLEITGEAETMLDPISIGAEEANFSVSDRDLVYVRGGDLVEQQRTLVWVDREGKETPIPAPARGYATARISPDGTRAALDVRDQTGDIWVWDFARQTMTPVSISPGMDQNPIWTHDGRRIIWSATLSSPTPSLYWQSADGSGEPQPLANPGAPQFATSVTADGRTILFFAPGGRNASMDILSVSTNDPKLEAQPVLTTPSSEGGAELSPDGRWMAYGSSETGENEIFVRPYPKVEGGRWKVSNNGGTRPVWSRDGRELFYLDRESRLTSVSVRPGTDEFSASMPANVLKAAYYAGRTSLGIILRSYDVAVDGRRFLMIKESDNDQGDEIHPVVTVMFNWAEELKARLP